MVTVFVGGSVFDGFAHRPGWQVAIDGNQIVAVGPEVNVAGNRVDVGGGLITPGFIDAHNHVVQGGLERIRCDLSGVSTKADYLALIKAYADANPQLEWIQGGGWAMSAFPGGTPLAADLDAILPDRPVYLPNKDHHGVWVNSKAFELAGIDRFTVDPVDGYFERDADGHPTGTVHEGAVEFFTGVLPQASADECYAGLMQGQDHMHSLGVTGWQDAILGPFMGTPDVSEVYLRAAEREALSAYVVGALWWERDRGVEQIEELRERRSRYTHGRLRASSVKIMQDGVAENFTAAMLVPYLDKCGHATANRGHCFVDADALKRAVAALALAQFQVHVHAIGDRGVREALDAFAHSAQISQDSRDLRHHIAHLQVIHPDDVPRFGALNVSANMQALWACWDDQMADLTVPFLSQERAGWQYRFRDLAKAGAHLAAGSDWPVSSANPMEAIHVAVNRAERGSHGRAAEPFLPDQALDLATAMAAYTSGSAWINHREGQVGAIAPGMVADLVVLDRDPFQHSAEEIADAHAVATYVEGVCVFGGH